MIDFQVDSTNNLVLNGFDLEFTPDYITYTIQRLQIKLKTFLGEYFLDNTMGVDYLGSILIKNPNTNLIADLLKIQITSEPDVTGITNFSLQYNNITRQLIVAFTVSLTNGGTASATFQLP